MRDTDSMQQKKTQTTNSFSSFLQLLFFTLFLFLLVAIPYTIYLKTHEPKATVTIAAIPTQTVHPAVMPTITPPPMSATTTCIAAPQNYVNTIATPAAYLFADSLQSKSLCFAPQLPPFPFTWQPYTSYQYGFTIDTPSNWTDETTTINHTTIHIFASESTQSTSALATSAAAIPSISFARYQGVDPYATQSAYLAQKITRDGKAGTVYTKSASFLAAVFPLDTGYFILEATRDDNSYFAFEHMLDSLTFTQ